MRQINVTDCLNNIQSVKNLIDKNWLAKEINKINSYKSPKNLKKLSFIGYESNFHPLAYLIHNAIKQLKSSADNKRLEVTEQIFQLNYLGENLSILRNNSVVGLDTNIRE